MKILEDKENFLLKRREILARVESDKTPSFDEIRETFAKEMGVDKELVAIKKVDGGFGLKNFRVKAFIYASKEEKEKTEKKVKVKKTASSEANKPTEK